ncbi:hypothetical protein TeGR_g14319 [Tetraparma gracilis]|uniref:Uncharacterized protein n=1 Tax=Tetraparma gracilis TaxID=2962635 RepID=A0ABQ6N612_9STRA|nr:hypothetical protein TeGR_g14319 [Tetraparma gracilis]
MLLCARYGEDSDLLSLLSLSFPGNGSVPVNHRDASSGNTALHLACANNHPAAVRLLLGRPGAEHLPNGAGNYPLHWAAANGLPEIARLLLGAFPDLDVLAQNEFGKSCLTEAFSANNAGESKENTELLRMLLEHKSAEEEKIITGIKGMTKEEVRVPEDMREAAISTTHVFELKPDEPGSTLSVREQVMQNADSPFTTASQDDTTGLAIWAASLVCGRWLASLPREALSGRTVLELGAGCGVPALAVARHHAAKRVCATDLNEDSLENCRHNIGLLPPKCAKAEAFRMDWADEATWPEEKIDAIIGADLVYTPEIVPLLTAAMDGLAAPGCDFYYVAPDAGRAGLADFIAAVKEGGGWEVVEERAAPEEMAGNPLASGDDDLMILHFNELLEKRFVLYHFRKLAN